MDARSRVQRALTRYSSLPAIPIDQVRGTTYEHLSTPDRLNFALGWIVADMIVSLRFADSAIDALPMFHPEYGWDRFLLTRRVSLGSFAHEPSNQFGTLMLHGHDAPHLVDRSGALTASLRQILLTSPELLSDKVDQLLPPVGFEGSELDWAWERKRSFYPTLYSTITSIILEQPGVVAARELLVDDVAVGGEFHPLFLHTAGRPASLQYDWFQVQYTDRLAFIRTHGEQAIFETQSGSWRTEKGGIRGDSTEALKRRILAWLRIEGEPGTQEK